MAQLLPGSILFTGKLSDLSAYKMRGSDKIILRAKGGPTKEHIKTSPNCGLVRLNNKEFSGRSSGAKQIRNVLDPLKFIADQNLTGPLNSLLRPIQVMDMMSNKGQRNIMISGNPSLLQGFNLNKRYFLDATIRNPLSYILSRETFSAQIEFPALYKDINFFVPDGNYPFYRFNIALGIVPDMVFKEGEYVATIRLEDNQFTQSKVSEWLRVSPTAPAVKMEIQLPFKQFDTSFSLMLAAGIAFGRPNRSGTIDPVKYTGSAKILGVV